MHLIYLNKGGELRIMKLTKNIHYFGKVHYFQLISSGDFIFCNCYEKDLNIAILKTPDHSYTMEELENALKNVTIPPYGQCNLILATEKNKHLHSYEVYNFQK